MAWSEGSDSEGDINLLRGVHAVQQPCMHLLSHTTLELEGGCQLVGLRREVTRQDAELLDGGGVHRAHIAVLVGGSDCLCDRPDH